MTRSRSRRRQQIFADGSDARRYRRRRRARRLHEQAATGGNRPGDLYNATHASVTICPITSDCVDAPLFRVTLPAGERTGLAAVSQVMVDKIVSVPSPAIARQIGRCDALHLQAIDDALRRWLDV